MIFIFVGVFIGVLIEQTYSLPNIKEKFSKCSKKSYGESTIQEESTKNAEAEPAEPEPEPDTKKSNVD